MTWPDPMGLVFLLVAPVVTAAFLAVRARPLAV